MKLYQKECKNTYHLKVTPINMLMQEPTLEMVEMWKEVWNEYKYKLVPNRKSGKQVYAFQGLDEKDIENYFCVSEYIACIKKFGILESVLC